MQNSLPLLILPVALMACTPEPEIDPDNPEDGRGLYVERCAACHGSTGVGDGPAALTLEPKPSDLTTLAERNDGFYDRDYVMSVIYSAPDQSRGALMPAFGHGDLGDLIIVEEDGVGTPVFIDLLALATYIETIQVMRP